MVSQISTVKAFAFVLSILSVAHAHMIMKTPIPYGRGTIDSSPLQDSGADFPCKNFFDMTDPVNDVNHLVPGVANTLSFTGSAVHGGGSCQVALTKDLKPTKSSKWMVIKSIEGGCPASVEGNLPADPNGSGASVFQYTVPQGFPEGDYTIAWTWFNKIGNREMYMNCGRAAIANSKKRYAPSKPNTIQHRDSDYPDIYKASLTSIFGGATCQIKEGQILKFPNPGPDVQVVGTPDFANTAACDALQASFDGGSVDSSPGNGAPSPDTGSGPSSAAASAATSSASGPAFGGAPTSAASAGFGNAPTGAPTAASASATGFMGGPPSGVPSGGNPGVFASGAASQSSAVATAAAATSAAATEAPVSSAVATATVSPLPASTGSPSTGSPSTGTPPSTGSPSGSNAQGSPCTDEGDYSCSSDGTSFQRCASGMWSAPIPMAAGTSCTSGISSNLSVKVINLAGSSVKRDIVLHANERRSRFHRRQPAPSWD